MRRHLMSALVGLAAAACLGAPTAAAQTGETAQETIAQLESQGFDVNVDRVGSGRIEDCVVTSVRNPQTQTRAIRDYYGRPDENGKRKFRIIEVVVSRSISVSLDCAQT